MAIESLRIDCWSTTMLAIFIGHLTLLSSPLLGIIGAAGFSGWPWSPKENYMRMDMLRSSFFGERNKEKMSRNSDLSELSVPPLPAPSRVYHVADYGADPTGENDSTSAIMRAVEEAFKAPPGGRMMMSGIPDLGGAEVHLDGGTYLISSPIQLPQTRGGNFKLHGGSIRASESFPASRYLVELWAKPTPTPATSNEADENGDLSPSGYDYEYITLMNLMLDSDFHGGGIVVVNSLRTIIDNCYISHFISDGIWVKGGHETYITTSYLGQHITAGGDPDERKFTGTAINLSGNDNSVVDVVIFSAAVGVLVSGQANTFSNIHCYNQATGFGGKGIYLKTPGLSQTRIVNSYLDYTDIVAEDPVQLHVSSSFFYGGAAIVFKSVAGKIAGVTIEGNMFSGGGGGDTIRLDESAAKFTDIDQVVIRGNSVDGMNLRSTEAKKATVAGKLSSRWIVDFSTVLLFVDRIKHVQYTFLVNSTTFPKHVLRDISGNRVIVEAESAVAATIYVSVDQN